MADLDSAKRRHKYYKEKLTKLCREKLTEDTDAFEATDKISTIREAYKKLSDIYEELLTLEEDNVDEIEKERDVIQSLQETKVLEYKKRLEQLMGHDAGQRRRLSLNATLSEEEHIALLRRKMIQQQLKLGTLIRQGIDGVSSFRLQERLSRIEREESSLEMIIEQIQSHEELSNVEQTDINNLQMQLVDTKGDLRMFISQAIQTLEIQQKLPIKLQHLEIPTFDGRYDKWEAYSQAFASFVMRNDNLDEITKMRYLVMSLKGEAEQIANGFPTTAENLIVLWKELEKRYENKRLIAESQLMKCINTKKAQNDDPNKFRNVQNRITETIQTLKNVPHIWEITLIQIEISKFDEHTKEKWHEYLGDERDYITTDRFEKFLQTRQAILDQTAKLKQETPTQSTQKPQRKYICNYCKKEHSIYDCKEFVRLTVENRIQFIRKEKLCERCMGRTHPTNDCIAKNVCKTCQKRHHSLLHLEKKQVHLINGTEDNTEEPEHGLDEDSTEVENIFKSFNIMSSKDVLLPTARIAVYNKTGFKLYLKALIDPGSQVSIITTNAAQLINASLQPTAMHIIGISNNRMDTAKFETSVEIHSILNTGFKHRVNMAVLKKITTVNPNQKVNYKKWNHLGELKLADPSCMDIANIDVLLGADVYTEIVEEEIVKGAKNTPMGIKTKLGYIVLGPTEAKSESPRQNFQISIEQLNDDIQRFWNQEEETFSISQWSKEEQYCEQHYIENTVREPSGRYVVALPFKPDQRENLEESKFKALACFRSLEKKFVKNKKFKEEYVKVIRDYIDHGHMRPLTSEEKKSALLYFMPHHAVLKESSSTTKTRVVFNASAESANGRSLNDNLANGPIIQNDLATSLLEFRLKKVGINADIEKMYRRIGVSAPDQPYQCIFWRKDEDAPVEIYALTTVTFGVKPAPFLAIRTIHKLADDERKDFPIEADILKKNMYVDDLLAGAETAEEAKTIIRNVRELMKRGNFKIRKWTSNLPEALEEVPEEDREIKTTLNIQEESQNQIVKTLGIYWDTTTDEFKFNVKLLPTATENLTKRKVLSEVARIFDPHGWLSPITVTCKNILKSIWKSKTDWDDKLPNTIMQEYQKIRETLIMAQDIQIPRWVGVSDDAKYSQVGFCDASEKAYASVIYLHVWDGANSRVSLLLAKTRVTPMKPTTIPRLELNSAKLLARFMKKVKNQLGNETETFYFSDSMIALYWMKKEPSQWKTYVANRVASIQDNSDINDWHHVISQENPADVASRGLLPGELHHCELWWHGPKWLNGTTENWKLGTAIRVSDPDMEKKKMVKVVMLNHTQKNSDPEFEIIHKYGRLYKLLRIIASIIRPLMVVRTKADFKIGVFSATELDRAEKICVKIAQKEEFAEEIDHLHKDKTVGKKSRLKKLTPLLDEESIIRVNGRLENLDVPYDEKHPMILPQNHHVTNLIIDNAHLELFHAGTQSTLYYIRLKYWIINGRETVGRRLKKCMRCARYRAKRGEQMMGNLPRVRLNFTRPFEKVGIDYAGPIGIKTSKLRNAPIAKAYIALFVCMATKAIHLEVASDQTTDAFLAALRRFVSRRGLCTEIYSDRGSNFIGAKNDLPEMLEECKQSEQDLLVNTLAQMHIEWKMIPPYAPHMGGLWEAGVKSTKHHLLRVMHNSRFTFEELATVLTQIEACLNSRPISEMSNDINDTAALTPGHFLIGSALKMIPERNIVDTRSSALTRWQQVQQRVQSFWKIWRQEFYGRLQQREKWHKEIEYKIGEFVLVVDECSAPSLWRLGRIVEIHPGEDKITRVASVRTENGVVLRPITKLCKMPLEADNAL